MKKLFLFTIVAMLFAACTSEPTRKFIGVWEPVGYEKYDRFVISSDTIKAVQCETGLEHLQTHYKILRDSVVELERCWLEEKAKGWDTTHSDFHPEEFFFEEVEMYIDKDGFLNIKPFGFYGPLEQASPLYPWLKLRRL